MPIKPFPYDWLPPFARRNLSVSPQLRAILGNEATSALDQWAKNTLGQERGGSVTVTRIGRDCNFKRRRFWTTAIRLP